MSDDFVLSDANIAEVQKRLPNRNGMTRAHGLWDKNGKPDVHNASCMKNCAVQEKIMSQLPGHARDAHGSLADQNRIVGPVRGVQTVKTAAAAPAAAVPAQSLANQSGCLACHAIATRLVGPSFSEIAAKYRSDSGAPARLVAKIRTGGSGAWGQVVMPPQPNLADDDAVSLVQWVLGGAK